jgi:hypothetical protein
MACGQLFRLQGLNLRQRKSGGIERYRYSLFKLGYAGAPNGREEPDPKKRTIRSGTTSLASWLKSVGTLTSFSQKTILSFWARELQPELAGRSLDIHNALKSSGISPNLLITLASLKSPWQDHPCD